METNNCRHGNNLFRMSAFLTALCLLSILPAGCGAGKQPPEEGKMALSVTSTAFREGDKIPDKYTCQGQDISPPIAWSEPPEGTQSFALIMDDPDAPGGVFTHWVIFNIPSNSRGLPEAIPTQNQLASGTLQGKNDFGTSGYGGPCPPPGPAHRYRFTLYVLDKPLDLKPDASKKQALDTMNGHSLAQGRLTGTYRR
jgi:Raf kinase inhibitor-like YbhB/YbcL family protein